MSAVRPEEGTEGPGDGDVRFPLPSQAVCRSSFRSPSGALLAARAKVMREVCLLLPCCGVPVLPPGLGAPKALKQDPASPCGAVVDVMLCGYRRMQPRAHPFHPSCCGCSLWMVHLQVVPPSPEAQEEESALRALEGLNGIRAASPSPVFPSQELCRCCWVTLARSQAVMPFVFPSVVAFIDVDCTQLS